MDQFKEGTMVKLMKEQGSKRKVETPKTKTENIGTSYQEETALHSG